MGGEANPSCFLVMNPASRGGAGKRMFGQIHREMKAWGISYRYAVTSGMEEAELFARHAVRSGYDVVVAVGGDGTINRVINSFYDNDGNKLSNARLGVIYTGTSPDFCLSYGLPIRDIPGAVRALGKGETKEIGIGRLRFADGSLRHFACCANIGIGPLLAGAANSGIRGRIGDKAGTFLSLLRCLKGYKPASLTVNGQRIPHVYNLSVGKTRYVASGLKIDSDLRPLDRRFYLLCIRGSILRSVVSLYRGARLPLRYGERIRIGGDAEVEFDGDAWGRLPVTVSNAPSLEVIYERA